MDHQNLVMKFARKPLKFIFSYPLWQYNKPTILLFHTDQKTMAKE